MKGPTMDTQQTYEQDQVDEYHADIVPDENTLEDLQNSPGPVNLYRKQHNVVRPAASDFLGFSSFAIPVSTPTALATPVRILDRRPEGNAAKVKISVVNMTGTGHIFLLRNPDDFSISLDAIGSPYCPYGYFLGLSTAASAANLELVTSERIYAVCVDTTAGVGGMVSVCSELFFAD